MLEENNFIYCEYELCNLGFAHLGDNVKIYRSVVFRDIEKIYIGNNVSINSFCVFSGSIHIDNNVVIGEFTHLVAKSGEIHIRDNVNIYQRVVIDADKNGDVIIDVGCSIETQCVITKSLTNCKDLKIPVRSII